MKQVIMNAYVIAKKIIESYLAWQKGQQTQEMHFAFCSSVRQLIGEEIYKDAYEMAEAMLSGKKVIRSEKPRVFEAVYKEEGSKYKSRKFFGSIVKAEEFTRDYRDVEINEHFVEV